MLTAALFMGGSTILSQSIPPLIWGVSAIGTALSILGVILGHQLLSDMKKSGDL